MKYGIVTFVNGEVDYMLMYHLVRIQFGFHWLICVCCLAGINQLYLAILKM